MAKVLNSRLPAEPEKIYTVELSHGELALVINLVSNFRNDSVGLISGRNKYALGTNPRQIAMRMTHDLELDGPVEAIEWKLLGTIPNPVKN